MAIGFVAVFLVSCLKKDNLLGENYYDNTNDLLKIASDPNEPFSIRGYKNRQAEILLKNHKNDSTYRAKIYKISINYYDIYDLKNFKRTSDLLYKKSNEVKDSMQIANAYKNLGNYYLDLSINDSSYINFIKAKKHYQKLNVKYKLSEINYDISLLQYYINDFLGSELSLVKSLKISKTIDDSDLVYKAYMLLGLNSFELKEYEIALNYNIKALQIIRSGKTKYQTESQIYSHLGCVYLKVKNYQKADKMFQTALAEKKLLLKHPEIFTFALDNYAYSRFKQKNYLQAINLFLYAAKIRDSLKINGGKNYNKLYLSEYYAAMKDTVKAINYAHESFNLSKSYRAPGDMLLALKQLAVVEPKNALKYAESYINISDSMHQLERETRNKFAKIAYETEEITNEKDTAVKQSGIFLSIAVLVFTFGVLLFIIFYQRNKQKKLQFDRQQQKANEEIYQLIQIQHEKIEEGRLIEKKRIARDLHDGIMNKLASTRFNLHLLTKKNDPNAFIKCTPYINDIHEIEKEIRNIAHDLNNDIFSENDSFKNTLFSFFEEQKQIIGGKWHIEISKEINWEIFKTNKKIHIFRIFQELLHNISKHAAAKNIIISSSIKDSHLFLEVYDDGKGFSLNAKKKGIGLQNIKIRVKACDGTLKILSDKGIGTKVIIKIPTQTENKTV